jgi:hypothetical protein
LVFAILLDMFSPCPFFYKDPRHHKCNGQAGQLGLLVLRGPRVIDLRPLRIPHARVDVARVRGNLHLQPRAAKEKNEKMKKKKKRRKKKKKKKKKEEKSRGNKNEECVRRKKKKHNKRKKEKRT